LSVLCGAEDCVSGLRVTAVTRKPQTCISTYYVNTNIQRDGEII